MREENISEDNKYFLSYFQVCGGNRDFAKTLGTSCKEDGRLHYFACSLPSSLKAFQLSFILSNQDLEGKHPYVCPKQILDNQRSTDKRIKIPRKDLQEILGKQKRHISVQSPSSHLILLNLFISA